MLCYTADEIAQLFTLSEGDLIRATQELYRTGIYEREIVALDNRMEQLLAETGLSAVIRLGDIFQESQPTSDLISIQIRSPRIETNTVFIIGNVSIDPPISRVGGLIYPGQLEHIEQIGALHPDQLGWTTEIARLHVLRKGVIIANNGGDSKPSSAAVIRPHTKGFSAVIQAVVASPDNTLREIHTLLELLKTEYHHLALTQSAINTIAAMGIEKAKLRDFLASTGFSEQLTYASWNLNLRDPKAAWMMDISNTEGLASISAGGACISTHEFKVRVFKCLYKNPDLLKYLPKEYLDQITNHLMRWMILRDNLIEGIKHVNASII